MISDWIAAYDTNILVSSMIAANGNEARAVRLVREQQLRPALSTPMLAGYRVVLGRAKFRLEARNIEGLLAPFLQFGIHVEPQFRLSISTHEPDNRLLECAEAANADFLITGNLRHFPASHGKPRILNAKSFLDVIEARG